MATVEEAASSVGGKSAGSEAPTLFLRKATGLVRGWSVRDSFIFACLSTTYHSRRSTSSRSLFIPKGQLLTARC